MYNNSPSMSPSLPLFHDDVENRSSAATASRHKLSARRFRRRRFNGVRIVLMSGSFVVLCLGAVSFWGSATDGADSPLQDPSQQLSNGFRLDERSLHRKLLQEEDNSTKGNEYPNDLFTMEQIKNGAIALYILGVIYMFVALAIVCDEFFVPALEVIIDMLKISEDVAGATFMAAGGSAPELFTSFIGVFIARSDVGIGTIVGSAVFNILFVIGMCAIISPGVLALTWWPLFRDVSFYSVSLICLIVFFLNNKIHWWEALILMLCYVAYVIFMKFNPDVESWVKSKIAANRVQTVRSSDNLMDTQNSTASIPPPAKRNPDPSDRSQTYQESRKTERSYSLPVLKGSSKFRHGVLQLMIHTIDPLNETKVHEKALKLHAIASINSSMYSTTENNHNSHEPNQNNIKNGAIPAISNGQLSDGSGSTPPRNISQQTTFTQGAGSVHDSEGSAVTTRGVFVANGEGVDDRLDDSSSQGQSSETKSAKDEVALEEENEPLDVRWPTGWRKRITYVLLAPLIFPLWLTIPDVRRPERRSFYPVSFIMSIVWIAGFSFLMNWWASVIGQAIGIPEAVMGLTFLAAGTSIPDLITSVIVAKKGFGDMAVSSSVGSNIFDVTVGLPLPWLLFGAIEGQPYTVKTDGLFCSIVLLFMMLILLIITIAAFKWRMNKAVGFTMLGAYAVFLCLSLLLTLKKINCPVEV